MKTTDALPENLELGAAEMIQKDMQVQEQTSQSSLNDLSQRSSESLILPPPPKQVNDVGNTHISCSDKDHGPSPSSSGTHNPSHNSVLTDEKTRVLIRETNDILNFPKPACQISSELSVKDVKPQARDTNNTFGRIRNMFEQQRDSEKSDLHRSKDLDQSSRIKIHRMNISVDDNTGGSSLEQPQVKCISQQASKYSSDQILLAKLRPESEDSPRIQPPKMVSKQSNSRLEYRSLNHEGTIELGLHKPATQTRSDVTATTNIEPNCATVQSLRHVFTPSNKAANIATSQKRVRQEQASQSPSLPSSQVRKKTSSTIQRIQEQLGLQSEQAATTNHMDTHVKDHLSAVEKEATYEEESATAKDKRNFTYTDRLQVDEKPYRHWQIMSRVVTAESKYILTPKSAQSTAGKSSQPGNPTLGLIPDSMMLERSWERLEKLGGSDAACKVIVDSPGSTQSQIKNGYDILEMPMRSDDERKPLIETKTSEPLLAVSGGDFSSHLIEYSKTVDTCAILQSQESKGQSQDCHHLSFPDENVETNLAYISRNNKNTTTSPTQPLPRPRQSACKNFLDTHNGFGRKDRGSYCFNPDTLDFDFVTANIGERTSPLNSTSNANKGTSPTSPMLIGEPMLDVFHNKNFPNTARPQVVGSVQYQTKSKIPTNNQFNKTINRISQSYTADRKLFQTNIDADRDNGHICLGQFDGSSKKIWEHRREKQDMISFSNHQDDKNKVRVNSEDSCPENRGMTRRINTRSTARPQSGDAMHVGSLRSVLSDLSSRFRHKHHERYVKVQAIRDYAGRLPGQLSFHRGQIIKQRTQWRQSSDGLSYGYFRSGALRQKHKGLFPASHVTPIDNADWSEGISPSSSMVSTSVCSSR